MSGPTITVIVEQDDDPVRGNFELEDGSPDLEIETSILARLDAHDVWAWCGVKVHAEQDGFVGESSSVWGCCYEDERDFREQSGYFEDLRDEALADLQEQQRYSVTLPNGGRFTRNDLIELARLIYKRWGNDNAAAAVAFRRLMQNSCSEADFMKLVLHPWS